MSDADMIELLKQIEKDIYVCSLESTIVQDLKSCAIHRAIQKLEKEMVIKGEVVLVDNP